LGIVSRRQDDAARPRHGAPRVDVGSHAQVHRAARLVGDHSLRTGGGAPLRHRRSLSTLRSAAPSGDKARRQDTLAFLNWNLPPLLSVFPEFPRRVLIVQAGDPMWRGGLSGPASMFLHSDRPLISENRTSTLLHELVHIAMRLRGDEESDWIVEGLAEYYSIESLRRSGGISERRYLEAIERLESWARRAPTLLAPRANGAVTARAVLTLRKADAEIRAATSGKASLDDVARQLARAGGEITLARFQKVAEEAAGRPVQALERAELTTPGPARAQ
jgi:predicted metalloprotease with PDZ domain